MAHVVETYRQEHILPETFEGRGPGQTITVCVPAHNEAGTIGHIAATLVAMQRDGLIDQVLVVADRCTDATAQIAAEAGAEVLDTANLFAELGACLGKGDVLWRALPACRGDIVVYVDGDSGREFGRHFVLGLAMPLLHNPLVQFVKGIYNKPLVQDGVETPRREGRVSLLAAKPAFRLCYPELEALEAPLSGEMAARRELLNELSFPADYGVEASTLIQVYERFRLGAFAQADLGVRYNRHQTEENLQKMASQVLATIFGHFTGQVFGDGSRVVRPAHAPRS